MIARLFDRGAGAAGGLCRTAGQRQARCTGRRYPDACRSGRNRDPGQTGRDPRRFKEAVLRVVGTGAQWRGLPDGGPASGIRSSLALTDALGNRVDFRLLWCRAHDLRAVPEPIDNPAADHLPTACQLPAHTGRTRSRGYRLYTPGRPGSRTGSLRWRSRFGPPRCR